MNPLISCPSLPSKETDDYPVCFCGSDLSRDTELHRQLPRSTESAALVNDAKPIPSPKLELSNPTSSPIPQSQVTKNLFWLNVFK